MCHTTSQHEDLNDAPYFVTRVQIMTPVWKPQGIRD